jgi:hypothetical protein
MRNRLLVAFGLCSLSAFAALGVACDVGTDCDFGKCDGPKVGAETPDGSSTDGGADVDASPIPPGCDLTKDPKTSPKCIDEDAGIFVAPNGKPGASGTRTDPVGSITDALPKLDGPKGRIPRIYVCAGDYSENISVSTTVDIFGGLDCASWAPDAPKPKFTAKAPGDFALKITGSKNISITDISFAAQAAGQTAANSIAAFVSEASGNVRLTRVDLAALEGANGATPAAPGADGAVVAGDLDGNNGGNPTTDKGGTEKVCTCVGGKTSTGGKGGDNGFPGENGKVAIVPAMPATATGAGGAVGACNPSGTGADGSTARGGNDGVAAAEVGDLVSGGWTPAAGGRGQDGVAGQGGGGGAGLGGAGGGSGSCGGCPGLGGEGGRGGGASVALLVFSSPNLSLSSATLSSKKAGDGGNGIGGGNGIAGGTPGAAANANACNGGKGGTGGNGGAGAGGAGGVSVGILYKGPKPASEGVTFTGGTKGAPGGGPGKPGPDGQAGQELEIK